MSNIEDAKAFIEKAAGYGSVLGLSTISELLIKLNNPQNDLDIIHVAGTNGKGSTCCFFEKYFVTGRIQGGGLYFTCCILRVGEI